MFISLNRLKVAMSNEEIERDNLYSIVTTDGKLTYEKALLSNEAKEWEDKMEQELDRLIEKTETAIPIHYKQKQDGKKPTYASVVLEQKPGKPKRIRIVFGGHMQEENPIWTSRNTDMAAKKLFLNKIVSEGFNGSEAGAPERLVATLPTRMPSCRGICSCAICEALTLASVPSSPLSEKLSLSSLQLTCKDFAYGDKGCLDQADELNEVSPLLDKAVRLIRQHYRTAN